MKEMTKFKLVFVGLFFLSCMCYTNGYAQVKNLDVFEDELIIEEDGFRWIETTAKDLDAWRRGELRYIGGAKDKNGKVIIPLSLDYDFVSYSNEDDEGFPPYFYVKRGNCTGAYTIDGRVIVEPKYGSVYYDIVSDVFVFQEYTVDPNAGGRENQVTNLFINAYSDKPCYSLGVSLTKKGEPYMSNNKIVSYSDFYTPYTAPKSYKGSYTSKSAPILNGANLATGLIIVATGAAIVAGISDLFRGSSGSNSSSNNKKSSSTNTKKNGFEITDVVITHESLQQSNGSMRYFDHAEVYYKNNNNYYVKVVLLVKHTDGTSFKTQKMTIDPYESEVEGWNSHPDYKKIEGVEIYSVEKAY